MWIYLDNLVLNADTGAKFLIYEYDNYGDKLNLPELVHETPAGAISYEGRPMGATVKLFLKAGTIEELQADLYDLSESLGATHVNIKFN